ncbi:prepilin-type N-terminal cleavage/methylation domain-containing protein [Pseudoalteromonas byunsanensis]
MSPFKQSGFTLVELLIVIVLMGLTSSVVLPNMWKQFEQVKRYSEKQQLTSLLHYAKQYAVYSGKKLEIKVADNSVEVREVKQAGKQNILQNSKNMLDIVDVFTDTAEQDTEQDVEDTKPLKLISFSYIGFEKEAIVEVSSKTYFLDKNITFVNINSQQRETIQF